VNWMRKKGEKVDVSLLRPIKGVATKKKATPRIILYEKGRRREETFLTDLASESGKKRYKDAYSTFFMRKEKERVRPVSRHGSTMREGKGRSDTIVLPYFFEKSKKREVQ